MRQILLLFLILGINSCKMSISPLETAAEINLEKYSGKWYDIAHFPASFLKGCDNITAEYSLTGKNYVGVFNRCIKNQSKEKSIRGKAFIVKGSNNAKLKVQFFWPIRADYWILSLDENYQYAVIGGPSRSYAWILARTPDPDEAVIKSMMDFLKRNGFRTEQMERTVHDKE